MSGLEVNKILASIILAILVVTIISNLGDIIIDIDKDEGLAISLVTDIIKPRQLTFDESKKLARKKLIFDLKLKNER